MVRYADDIVVGFEHQADAERFLAEMRERLAVFALTLHGEKTRLIRFGRFAAQNRKERGEGKPETFNFLGFTHICGRSRRGGFQLKRKTRRDRMQARLLAIREGLRRRMHTTLEQQGDWLRQVMGGFPRVKPGGMLRLSRRADQCRCPGGVPRTRDPALAAHAAAAQSEGSDLVGTDHHARRTVASQATHHPPLARQTLRRQTPKVGAVCGKSARTVLCGGRAVRRVPTAIEPCRIGRRAPGPTSPGSSRHRGRAGRTPYPPTRRSSAAPAWRSGQNHPQSASLGAALSV